MLKVTWVWQWVINGECKILLNAYLLKTNFIYKIKHGVKNMQLNIILKYLLSVGIRLTHWTQKQVILWEAFIGIFW